MGDFILIIAIVFGSITIITLGCVRMGTSYFAKKHGLTKGASQREIDALQKKVSRVQEEVEALKKEVRRLIKIAKGIEE